MKITINNEALSLAQWRAVWENPVEVSLGTAAKKRIRESQAQINKVIAGGSGYKLVCKRGSTVDHDCLASTCATLGNRFVDLGSTVSLDYFDRRPFRFDGKIGKVAVRIN